MKMFFRRKAADCTKGDVERRNEKTAPWHYRNCIYGATKYTPIGAITWQLRYFLAITGADFQRLPRNSPFLLPFSPPLNPFLSSSPTPPSRTFLFPLPFPSWGPNPYIFSGLMFRSPICTYNYRKYKCNYLTNLLVRYTLNPRTSYGNAAVWIPISDLNTAFVIMRSTQTLYHLRDWLSNDLALWAPPRTHGRRRRRRRLCVRFHIHYDTGDTM